MLLTGTSSPPRRPRAADAQVDERRRPAHERAGRPTVAEQQWPALSTQFGAISVPVQRKLLPNVISAIDG